MEITEALAWLDAHVNPERSAHRISPTLERMERVAHLLGNPEASAPVIHITGTNGKGSTAQIATRLLMANGLSVGTYASPHLVRVHERIARNGEPIDDESMAEALSATADLEVLAGVELSYFEILTAAAFRWFADVAVDAVVLEVGLLGRWDATNIADGRVAVVTNVDLDHTDYAGPTRRHIAAEKAGIIKPDATVVLGETDPDLLSVFDEAARAAKAHEMFVRGDDFACEENRLALGGRLLDIRTPGATYPELFLPLHGAHQGDNASAALTAAESFFGGPLDPMVVSDGLATVVMPGRFEIVGHQPLVILDGAHNPAGASVVASVVDSDFDPAGSRIYVVGMLSGRDPGDMLDALDVQSARLVIACTPPTPRAIAAADVARAATDRGVPAVVVESVARAVERAIDESSADDLVLITGSLYVVGAARGALVGRHADHRPRPPREF